MTLIDTFARFDAMWQQVEAQSAKQGKPVTCRGAGCSSCCKEALAVTRQEADLIVASIPPEQRSAVAQRTQRWLTIVQASGMLKEPEPHIALWNGLQAWCPLLVDGQCSVYAVRPISCRSHVAIGDPALCTTTTGRMRQIYLFHQDAVRNASADLLEENGEIVTDHLGVHLAEILLGKVVKSTGRWSLRTKGEGEEMMVDFTDFHRWSDLESGTRIETAIDSVNRQK